MAIDAVLFDLDDTLYDHRHARLAGMQAIRQVEPALGRFPLSRLDRTFERLLNDIHVSLVLTGKISLTESRWLRMTKLLEEYRIQLPRPRIQQLIDIRIESYMQHRRPVPGAPVLLRYLQDTGATVAVVTNNLRSEQVEKLRFMGLEGLVDHLVCSEQVGVTKPDPRIFRVALQRAHTRPQHAVMVGDSWDSDVAGATKVGMRAVWFHRDSRPLPSHPRADDLRSFRPLARASSVILGGRRRAKCWPTAR